MTEKTIGELPLATVVNNDDLLEIEQSGVSKRAPSYLIRSYLAAETARVDPSGDDSTGVIGDLTKPFLTTQGAIDAFELLDPLPSNPIIDIGGNTVEGFSTILPYLSVIGANGFETTGSQPTASAITTEITMGATDGPTANYVVLILKHCWFRSITFSGGGLNHELDIIDSGGPAATAGSNATGEFDIHGTSFNNALSQLSQASILGGDGTSIQLFDITVGNLVSDTGTDAYLTRSVVTGVVTAAINNLYLTDSFVSGTNSAGTISFLNNVLFNPANWDFSTLPTSPAGLPAGAAWVDPAASFVVKISQGPV